MADLQKNFSLQVKDLSDKIDKMVNYRLKNDPITLNDLDSAVKEKLVKNFETIVFAATETISGTAKIDNATSKDIIYLNYINGSIAMRLIEGQNADYMLVYNQSDNSAEVILRSDLIADTASIVIDIIRIGE